MLVRLLLFFTIFPLVELTLLLLLGKYTTVATAVAFVLITGAVGAVMLRWHGLQALRKVQQDLEAGRKVTDSFLDGVLIVLASVLLITPGVLTDFVGITLLIPWCRRGYRRLASWYFLKRYASRFPRGGQPAENRRTEVIDSNVVETPPRLD